MTFSFVNEFPAIPGAALLLGEAVHFTPTILALASAAFNRISSSDLNTAMKISSEKSASKMPFLAPLLPQFYKAAMDPSAGIPSSKNPTGCNYMPVPWTFLFGTNIAHRNAKRWRLQSEIQDLSFADLLTVRLKDSPEVWRETENGTARNKTSNVMFEFGPLDPFCFQETLFDFPELCLH